jgi:hypothetical protein
MLGKHAGRWATALALVAAVGVTGCESEGGEAEPGEVPEMAEVEPEDLSEGQVEFQEALPLTVEDIGDTMLMTGTVIGTVIPDGFFVATEHGEVLFVAADEAPVPGELVSVTGTLQSAEVPVFEEWETEALENEIEAEWQMLRTYYIEAGAVATP